MSKILTRAVAARIAALESDVVAHSRAGNRQQALCAAQTAAYLRAFLTEYIGPLWHAWAVDASEPVEALRDSRPMEARS